MGRRVGLVTAILLLMLCVIQPISAAYNQSKTKEIQTPDQDNPRVVAELTVKVYDKNTSTPISGAWVVVRKWAPGRGFRFAREGFTDSQGRVTFYLPKWYYFIAVHKLGYSSNFSTVLLIQDKQLISISLEEKSKDFSYTEKDTPKTKPDGKRDQQVIRAVNIKPILQITKIFRSVKLISRIFH